MLEMKDACERCETPLAQDGRDARICSFECTWCASCATEMGDQCPNCAGELVVRPTRAVG